MLELMYICFVVDLARRGYLCNSLNELYLSGWTRLLGAIAATGLCDIGRKK